MSRRVISILVVIVVAVAAPFVFWKVRDAKAKAEKRDAEILKGLTKDDIALVLKSQSLTNPEKANGIVRTEQSRKAFLSAMKEYLSLASRARREGLAEDRNLRLSLQIKESGLLSELYASKMRDQGKGPFNFSKEEMAAFWTNPENEKQFNAELDALYAVQKAAADNMESDLVEQSRPQGESLDKTRAAWAKARTLSQKARADAEFMQERTTQLRLKILEASVLSTAYLARYWKDNIKATDKEIAAYVAAHPELDLRKKREKAEMVLRRARNGEDFASLAREFSEDRPTRDKGGLYKNYEKGQGLWTEIENVALGLEPGQIADKLVETKDGYHIVQLVSKTAGRGEDGRETVYLSVRHILLQRRFEDLSVKRVIATLPAPFKTPEEIAKREVEKEKHQRLVDSVVQQEKISLPVDFEFS
jgi:parvulin-like peptidyl-prolyl isomerase